MNGNEARHHQAVKAVKGKIYSKLGFVVTDVCYVLREDYYTNFWGKKHNYADGIFEINGFRFAVGSTAYGDGVYFDNEAHKYPVDAGNIALVPLELVGKEDGLSFRTVFGIPGEAEFTCENGVFDIALPNGHKLHIDTRIEDYEDEDEDEDRDYYDRYEDGDDDYDEDYNHYYNPYRDSYRDPYCEPYQDYCYGYDDECEE
ncbi:MAG: hypothetical protein IKN30_09035 [Synergistaceae bacterium]|nr:hypothetical protein [Synergistaceae bacterium]